MKPKSNTETPSGASSTRKEPDKDTAGSKLKGGSKKAGG